MTRFVIFTTPRTGSTLLIKTLDTHPEIFCAGELFFFKGNIYHTESRYPFWRVPFLGNKLNYLINYPKLSLTLPRFLNKFYASHNREKKAVGFKLMQFQTYYTPGIFDYLKREKIKVIVMIRKNVLRNTLSDLKARATKVYHNESNGIADSIPAFKVDLQDLERKMSQINNFNIQLEKAAADLDSKIIYYEDLVNWDQTINSILKYLGVSIIPLKAASAKLNPENLNEMIVNYEEMRSWLAKNSYEKYLE